jgi:hypothetical protein
LKKGGDEISSKIHPTPKFIERNKKKKKTKRSTLNKTFLVCHYCKKRGHTIDIYWYAEACSHFGKKGHCEVACWEKQFMFHELNFLHNKKDKKTYLTQKKTQRNTERSMSSNPYHSIDKNFHHYKLIGHWEEKCWWLHSELHPRNYTTKRRVCRVNIVEDEECPASPIQEVEVVQEETTMRDDIDTTKIDNKLIPRESITSSCVQYCIQITPSWTCVRE